MNEIAQRLYEFLQSRGLSVNKAAHDCGISTRQLNDFVSGVSQNMQLSSVAAICRTYDISADYILLGRETQRAGDQSIVSSPNAQQVNDTTFFDLSNNKSVINGATAATIDRLSTIINHLQATISSQQSSINQLTKTNQLLVDRLVSSYLKPLNP